MNAEDIAGWLRCEDRRKLEELWERADRVRRDTVGDDVHLRGLIEISNFCVRRCAYCGIRAPNTHVTRYRITDVEILDCADKAVELGYGTVVLQAGEDDGLTRDWVVELVRAIKERTGLAITLSLGERPTGDFVAWRKAGADRYLLRFETSDHDLYDRIHPPRPGQEGDRFSRLRLLRDLGYEVGSGVLIGIPGQNFDSLAVDIALFAELDLDMIGVGPFIPHPETPLGREPSPPVADQVPATDAMAYKVLALARLVCPESNIPSTTAIATLDPDGGRATGLSRGANVVMPNLTPDRYRVLYEIYPDKSVLSETSDVCRTDLNAQLLELGRRPGRGPGNRTGK